MKARVVLSCFSWLFFPGCAYYAFAYGLSAYKGPIVTIAMQQSSAATATERVADNYRPLYSSLKEYPEASFLSEYVKTKVGPSKYTLLIFADQSCTVCHHLMKRISSLQLGVSTLVLAQEKPNSALSHEWNQAIESLQVRYLSGDEIGDLRHVFGDLDIFPYCVLLDEDLQVQYLSRGLTTSSSGDDNVTTLLSNLTERLQRPNLEYQPSFIAKDENLESRRMYELSRSKTVVGIVDRSGSTLASAKAKVLKIMAKSSRVAPVYVGDSKIPYPKNVVRFQDRDGSIRRAINAADDPILFLVQDGVVIVQDGAAINNVEPIIEAMQQHVLLRDI